MQGGLAANGFDLGSTGIDGVWGPVTQDAYNRYRIARGLGQGGEPLTLASELPNDTPAELDAFYGKIRGGKAQSQVYIDFLPYPMYIAWDKEEPLRRIRVHKLVRPNLIAALIALRDEFGMDYIRKHGLDMFGGASFQRKRTSNSKIWSTHAYGCAIDLNPVDNGWKVRRPDATMPLEVIQLFARYGFINLGSVMGHDYMHFQMTKKPSGYPIYL